MTKQEIVNKMATRANFHKYVEVCLAEGLEIQKLKLRPEINVYHDFIQEEFKHSYAGNWTSLDPRIIDFKVNNVWMKGVENFFKNYKEITKIKMIYENHYDPSGDLTIVWDVIPNMIGGKQWSLDDDFSANGHYEISFDAHSYAGPAMVKKHTRVDEEILEERYMIEGEEVTKETFLKESREHKLSRVLGVDLKAERLQKEKEEQERKKKEEEEKKKEIRKSKQSEWSYHISYEGGGSNIPMVC
jgi:hypothetical protein